MKLLLEMRIDVNLTNRYGETALHKAARIGSPAMNIIRMLLAAGANAFVSGVNGLPSGTLRSASASGCGNRSGSGSGVRVSMCVVRVRVDVVE